MNREWIAIALFILGCIVCFVYRDFLAGVFAR